MKLIDILVQELDKLGGWPDGVNDIEMLEDGSIFFDGDLGPEDFKLPQCSDGWNRFKSSRDYTNSVTREQYEAALAASKTEWNGEGLPPVGCECEYETNGYGIKKVRVECITMDGIAFTWLGEDPRFRGLDCINTSQAHRFRPIRSEADKKKEAVEKAIADALLKDGDFDHEEALRLSTFVYGAISRNDIPHIRID